MTTEERLRELEDNERNARQAFMDKADGASASEKKRLKENLEKAEAKPTEVQAEGLKKTSSVLDKAVSKLKTANAENKAALASVMQISALLKKLEKATELAGKVLLAAAAIP